MSLDKSGLLTSGLTDETLDLCRRPIWDAADDVITFHLVGTPVYGMIRGDVDRIERTWSFNSEHVFKTENGIHLVGSASHLSTMFKDDDLMPKEAKAVYWEMDVVGGELPMARFTFVQQSYDTVGWATDIRIEITGGPEGP